MSTGVQPGLIVESRRIDDQRIAVPSADRVAAPRGLRINGKRAAVRVDLPVRVVHFIQHRDDARRLQDL
jgi:hypothetical protein